jgi:FkbM family methyltransferase
MQLRSLLKKTFLELKSFRRPSVRYCAENNLLPSVFTKTAPEQLRRILLLPKSSHETQLNQDVFALLANKFRPGFFVEIGANDGFTLSNTLTLEQQFNWNGLLIEANPEYRDSLKRRRAMVEIAAVVRQEGYYDFRSAGLYGGVADLLDGTHEERTRDARSIKVWGTTLEKLLKKNHAPGVINFISIDVEGAEVPIVEDMCRLQDFRFLCGCIEYNNRRKDYLQITAALREAGYREVWQGQTAHDLFFVDGRQFPNSD